MRTCRSSARNATTRWRTRDEVLQFVSHDLRNMLGTIKGMAALIEQDADPSEGDRGTAAHARWIMQAAARMNRLIGDLTDVASIEAGTLALSAEMADPAAIVSEAVETFHVLAAERSIELVAEIAAAVPQACIDPARIYQVVANLLSNAIKFTPRGGKIVVHGRSRPGRHSISRPRYGHRHRR